MSNLHPPAAAEKKRPLEATRRVCREEGQMVEWGTMQVEEGRREEEFCGETK